jgi:hypothetical protein
MVPISAAEAIGLRLAPERQMPVEAATTLRPLALPLRGGPGVEGSLQQRAGL